jgi:hypothetical protein
LSHSAAGLTPASTVKLNLRLSVLLTSGVDLDTQGSKTFELTAGIRIRVRYIEQIFFTKQKTLFKNKCSIGTKDSYGLLKAGSVSVSTTEMLTDVAVK